ncbi:MAG TPA: hypothetical protein PLK12_01380 [Prolixibacteraceae bacterium]|nr:hypothetical protein [Prolixibacteraceae bacterium]
MKKKINVLILLIGVASSVFGQRAISIPAPQGASFIESPLIEAVSFFPLEQEKINMILPEMELRYSNKHYFILDNKYTQCVYRYNENGELINTICEVKDEKDKILATLNNPASFSIDPFREQVEIYNFQKSTVQRLSFDGTFIDEIPFPIHPSDFTRDKQGNYWIYSGWNHRDTQYRLLIADKNGKVIDRKMRLNTRCVTTSGFAFSYYKEDILLWESLGNLAYSIRDNTPKERYLFSFGTFNLPLDFHITDPQISYQRMNNNGYYSIKKYLENDRFAYFFLNFTNTPLLQKEMIHIIHDKQADKIHILNENSGIGAFDKAHALTESDELVFLISPRKIRQLLSGGVEYVPDSFYGLDEDLRDVRLTCVLKIKLRSEKEPSGE